MSLPETAADYFTDALTMTPWIALAPNGLGEPQYVPSRTPTQVAMGLLLPRTSRVWRELGLGDDVEAVFFCEDAAIPEGERAVLTAGGRDYRRFSLERVKGLDGAASLRILLYGGGA